MSMMGDQPFSENEERYFLAEILKKSNLSPITLINLIQDEQIEPAWDDIALPNGRSVSACKYALNSLVARTQQRQPTFQPPLPPSVVQESERKLGKRPYSMGDAVTSIIREIQPRPIYSNFNGPPPIQSPLTMSPVEPPRKKRGRPTKAEYEKRFAEASAKGEIWPKPRNKAKTRRISEPIKTESSTAQGSDAMDESGGETAGPTFMRSEREVSDGAPPAAMSPRPAQNLPLQQMPPVTPRASIQEMIQPAGQVSGNDARAEPPSRFDPAPPFYLQQLPPPPPPPSGPPLSQQSPPLPHSQPPPPRLPATTLMQSYSPRLAPFHSTNYPSPPPPPRR